MKNSLTVLMTGEGYIGSRWCEINPSGRVGKIVRMEGHIPEVNPEEILNGIDVVLHLAALTPPKGDAKPSEYDLINRKWTEDLGTACLQRGVKILFLSTGSIYAGTDGSLLPEDTSFIRPQNLYAESKYRAERALGSLGANGLQYAILRLGSVFGAAPRMNFNPAVNKFMQQAKQGKPLTVWEEAVKSFRPYTYVGDAAAAIQFIIERDLFNGEAYNIVSHNATIEEIVAHIKNIFPGLSVALERKGQPHISFGMDDRKIRALGFNPHGTLPSGIAEVADFLATNTQPLSFP